MGNRSFVGLNTVQRQSLIISLTAFFTSLLLIALLSVLLLIGFRGTSYFWPERIYNVEFKNGDGAVETVLANYFDNAEDEIILKYADSQHPYGSQLLLSKAHILSKQLAKDSAEIKLNDGRRILAVPQHIVLPDEKFHDMSELADVMSEVTSITAQIEALNEAQLAPIHEALSQFDKRNVAVDAPAREKLVTSFKRYQQEVLALENRRAEYQPGRGCHHRKLTGR